MLQSSGNDYTIARPGWFDYNDDDQLEITMLQGDTRHAGSPADGVIARHQIARVLVDSLASDVANHKTFELVAERGPAQGTLDPVFAALDKDPSGSLDGVRDQANMPLDAEPERARQDRNRMMSGWGPSQRAGILMPKPRFAGTEPFRRPVGSRPTPRSGR